MAEVHRLPPVEIAEREASEWIARLNADVVSDEERVAFEAWYRAHARHARAYEELAATWSRFTNAGRIARTVSFGQTIDAAARSAAEEASPLVPSTPSGEKGRSKKNTYLAVLSAAAALVAVAVVVWWALAVAPQTTFQTAIGEHASIALPDGSTLDLNSNSHARIDYTPGARIIRLSRGEAYFKVAHDTARPFWVVAGDSWVRAVGTAFNVYLRPEGVRVTVSEGVVKVAAGRSTNETPSDASLNATSASVLTAGQQVQLRGAGSAVRAIHTAELTRTLSWRQGLLHFENQPLGEVVDEISRYTTLDIVLEDDALRRIPVGGSFQASPAGAEALLIMLVDGFKLDVRRASRDRAYVSSVKDF